MVPRRDLVAANTDVHDHPDIIPDLTVPPDLLGTSSVVQNMLAATEGFDLIDSQFKVMFDALDHFSSWALRVDNPHGHDAIARSLTVDWSLAPAWVNSTNGGVIETDGADLQTAAADSGIPVPKLRFLRVVNWLDATGHEASADRLRWSDRLLARSDPRFMAITLHLIVGAVEEVYRRYAGVPNKTLHSAQVVLSRRGVIGSEHAGRLEYIYQLRNQIPGAGPRSRAPGS